MREEATGAATEIVRRFRDETLTVEVTGADEERADNRITLTIEQAEFELIVDGFDQKRDLVVDYNLARSKEAALA